MLNLIPFKFKNFSQLQDMLKSQSYPDVDNITMKTLPKIGFIALLNDQPIAAGFLRRLEPCYAHLDTLVSNAFFGSQIRHEGVKLVVDALLTEAKQLKLEGLVATTSDEGVLTRAKSLGFHVVDQKVIGIKI